MRIKSIRRISCDYKRYDIQTKNHNFFANGILVHNSIIKIVNLDGNFLISTNGVIDAFKCSLSDSIGCPYSNFGELFMEGMKFYGLTIEDFPRLFAPGFTYMFELTSPWNQVVVQWPETKVSLIGIRNNSTLKETFFGDSELAQVFDTPRIFPITNIDQCVEAAKALPDDAEGYVVVDAEFNRIKIKSPRYVQLHYMAGNQTWGAGRVLEILLANEVSEYIAYFPKFKAAFDVVKAKYDAYVEKLEALRQEIDEFWEENYPSKKDFAMWVFADPERKALSGFAFAYFDCSFGDSDKGIRFGSDYAKQIPTSKLVEILGL